MNNDDTAELSPGSPGSTGPAGTESEVSSTSLLERAEHRPPVPPEAFDAPANKLWADHCAEGPVPNRSLDAIRRLLSREAQPWTMRWQEDFQGLPQSVRTHAGRLFGADADDITLTATTTAGLSLIARGLPWQPGDEILAPLGEFPSNVWPWKSLAGYGVRFREIPLWDGHRSGAQAWLSTAPTVATDSADPESRILDAIGPRTRLVTVSWVRFQDGLKLDLERVSEGCQRRGVDFVVDGVQGAGTMAIDLKSLPGVSAFASGGHKGLLSPQGLGILWTSAEFRQRLTPPGGWLSVKDAVEFDRPSTDFDRGWAEDGSKLEVGVPNLVGCAAMASSLEMLADADPALIERHIKARQDQLLNGLADVPLWRTEVRRLRELHAANRLGAILGIHHGTESQHLGLDQLNRRMIDGFDRGVYTSVREGYHRIALHGYHTVDQVEKIVAWLAQKNGELMNT